MLRVYCSCGIRLEAATKKLLFRRYRRHVDETHVGSCLTDEQIQAVITANSFERTDTPGDIEKAKEYGVPTSKPEA
jgi:hypothetical protein